MTLEEAVYVSIFIAIMLPKWFLIFHDSYQSVSGFGLLCVGCIQPTYKYRWCAN